MTAIQGDPASATPADGGVGPDADVVGPADGAVPHRAARPPPPGTR